MCLYCSFNLHAEIMLSNRIESHPLGNNSDLDVSCLSSSGTLIGSYLAVNFGGGIGFYKKV